MNNTAKTSFVLMGTLLIVLLAGQAIALSAPALDITLMSQDPDPVGPNSYVDLRFKVQNTGDTPAESVILQIAPEFPFSLNPGDNATTDIGTVPSTGASKNVIITKYRLRVDQNALEGTNTIKLNYRIASGQWITETYDVNVETSDASIAIDSVKSSPETIVPGQPAIVNITLRNSADSTLKDVTIKLDLTFSTLTSSAAITDPATLYANLPFAPLGSATEKKIRYLNPGESYTFSYSIIANSDTVSRIYKMPVQVKFSDEKGTVYTKNDIIGLVVGAKPEISAVVDSTDLTIGKTTGKVILKFINKGTADVQFLDVKLNPSTAYDILSASEVYVGKIDSDDYQTADFKLYVKPAADMKANSQEISLPVSVTYKDANGETYSADYAMPMVLYNPKVLGNGGSSPVMYIVIAVVLVGGFFIYRRSKRRKK